MSDSQGCVVCKAENPRYKCPKCHIALYCSIPCNKAHQENCTQAPPENQLPEKTTDDSASNEESSEDEDAYRRIEKRKLKMLRQSEKLKSACKNPNFQNVINMIHNAKDPESVLSNLMSKDREFSLLTEEMLRVTEFQQFRW